MISSRSLLVAAFLPFLPCAARGAITRVVERSFPVAAGSRPLLEMEVFYGNIMVEEGAADEIRIQIKQDFEADNEASVERIAGKLSLDLTPSDKGLSVKAEYSRKLQWSFENWPPVKLYFTLRVPRTCDLNLFTRDGSVLVGELDSKAQVRTHYGRIHFKGITGSIQARSQFGDISIAHCRGPLNLRSISGSFQVGPVTGHADVFGYGGEIEVSSSGGGIKAETSGADLSVGFAHPIQAPAVLKTGGADIILTLDPRSACELDLRSSLFGKVINLKDSLPLELVSGAPGKNSRVQARLNGGGPQIRGRASGGNVFLKAAPVAD